MRKSLLVLVFALVVMIPTLTLAQATAAGTVVGVITDQSGAVISGAQVTLTDAATGSSRNASTNAAGAYVFVNVNPGSHSLAVSKQGFATTRASSDVSVGVTTTINLALTVGAASTVVEVTAAATELQTTNAHDWQHRFRFGIGIAAQALAAMSAPS